MTREEAKEYLDNYRKMYAELATETFLEALDVVLDESSENIGHSEDLERAAEDAELDGTRWLGWRKATKKLNEANCGIQFYGNLFPYLRKKGELDGLCRKNGREWEYDTDGIIEKARANKFNYKGLADERII